MKLQDGNLQVYEINSFTHLLSCILPSFSQNTSQLLLPKRLWKCASTFSFRKYKRKGVLLLIYLFSHDSSESSFFMLNMAFDVASSTVFVKWIGILCFLQCKDYKNILLFNQLLCVNCSPSWWYAVLFYFNICIKFTLSSMITTMKKW